MPEHRLQKTRDAYDADRPITLNDVLEFIDATAPPITDTYRLWTDEHGVTHRERIPRQFEVY